MKAERSDVRQRVFDAAVALFARKGYESTGLAEIARHARTGASQAKAYFGDKEGLLRAVLDRYYERYYEYLRPPAESVSTPLDVVRHSVDCLVRLFRENTELAVAAENCSAAATPQMIRNQVKAAAQKRPMHNEFFAFLGLDLSDPVAMSLFRGLITTVLSSHFRRRYYWERVLKAPRSLARLEKRLLKEPEVQMDDAYYQRFTDLLTRFYVGGLATVAGAKRPEAKSGNVEEFWLPLLGV